VALDTRVDSLKWMGMWERKPKFYRLRCPSCKAEFETLSYVEMKNYLCPFCGVGTMETV